MLLYLNHYSSSEARARARGASGAAHSLLAGITPRIRKHLTSNCAKVNFNFNFKFNVLHKCSAANKLESCLFSSCCCNLQLAKQVEWAKIEKLLSHFNFAFRILPLYLGRSEHAPNYLPLTDIIEE